MATGVVGHGGRIEFEFDHVMVILTGMTHQSSGLAIVQRILHGGSIGAGWWSLIMY